MDETMIQKVERLQKMYDYARSNNLCKNKSTFSALVGFSASNISRAFSGVPRFLTDSLLTRINQAIGCPFSTSWVLYGEGDMFANSEPQESSQDVPESVVEESIPNASERIKHLEDLVETLQAFNKVLRKDNERLEKENDALKNEKYYTTARTKNA